MRYSYTRFFATALILVLILPVSVSAETIPPTTPTNVTTTPNSPNKITITWNASTDTGGSLLKGYHIYRNGSLTPLNAVAQTSRSYANTGLATSTTYTYQVEAIDNDGNRSPKSPSTSGKTMASAETIPPATPTSVVATPNSPTQITLTWSGSTDTGGSGLKGYHIYRNGSLTPLNAIAQTGRTYTNIGLATSTTYSYQIQAIDNAGNISLKSALVATRTLSGTTASDTTKPTTPGQPIASSVTQSTLKLNWTPSTDAGGSNLAGYRVYRNGTQIATPLTVTYDESNLTPGTAYSYTVLAYDGAGNRSATSTPRAVTTVTGGTSLNVSNLNGTNGFNLLGFNANDQVGRYVDGIGDINNDGYADIIISGANVDTPTTVGTGEGESYVILGSASGRALDGIYLSSLNGTNGGFRLHGGIASGGSGAQVRSAGNVNNDLYDDLIIGTPNLGGLTSSAGIYFGRTGTNASSDGLNIETLSPGASTGLKLTSASTRGLGLIMDGNGDFNGDGYSDAVVGQVSVRQAYMVFGKPSFGSNLSMSASTATSSAINFTTSDSYDGFGAIGYAGDVDNDGRDDLMIGIPGLFNGDDGRVVLIYGTTSPANLDNLDLVSTVSNSKFTVFKAPPGSAGELGRDSVTGIGDINKDGIDDFAMVAPYTDVGGRTNTGSVYVVFGNTSRAALSSVDLNALNGTNGFRVDGGTHLAATGYELQVASAGDFNGDTIADFIVGDSGFTTAQGGGRVYVIFGSTGSFASLNGDNLSTVMDGISDQDSDGLIDGFTITGQYSLGRNIAGAGDMNNDGFDDLILGAYVYTDPYYVSAGAANVVYGWNPKSLSKFPKKLPFTSKETRIEILTDLLNQLKALQAELNRLKQ